MITCKQRANDKFDKINGDYCHRFDFMVLTGPFIVNYRTGINVWPVKEKRKTVSVNGILKVKRELL